LQKRAHVAVAEAFAPAAQTFADADAFLPRCVAEQKALCERRQMENLDTRDRAIAGARQKHDATVASAQARRDQLRDQYDGEYPPRLEAFVAERDESVRKLDEAHRQRMETVQREHNDALAQAEQHHAHAVEELHSSHASQKHALEETWHNGLTRLRSLVQETWHETNRAFPDWVQMAAEDWQGQPQVPPAMKLGDLTVGLRPPARPKADSDVVSGIPDAPLEPTFTLPALVPCPTHLSLLLEAKGEGRRAAVKTLQAYMLRLVSSLPPAKCRFTIIDPVGLGENFAAFMHLADYDDQLISRRIWTEPRHIEQRLVDLSEHMENVIQKYLRNEFKTIDEYNHYADEVAEPFRFLVVANFPANFSEAAARRLMSIAASGPRCGVFVLLGVDADQPMPPGFSLGDIRAATTSLVWRQDRFVGREGLLAEYPSHLESPPPDEICTRLLHNVGRQAKQAGKVEVPFEAICPPREEYWKSSARTGLDVPLGRAGATRLQAMKLGSGTSQHVLVSGKTGSGKSTLLHALITSIALRYSPDEVELYLVDFKQGVEFKTYAVHALPHARVVAIESDREFGLSVLEKLDAELRRRAELFRQAEVQDLAGYRDAQPDSPLPRVMLIVDEFQEFFTEDDRTAHESSLLLDRLVRQGRAFGIHVLLGSQTLGGAYTLARSTIGQMAVRIALQCSEADAHLILSEDNTAARLLSRPGEAIYNDSNGLIEGNHPFQVVWLPDERREHFLDQVLELNHQSGLAARPRLVFEGNVPADLEKNHLLAEWLSGTRQRSDKDAEWIAWLGDAVSIKDPTAATFGAHSGSNLLIVGQNDEAAIGMFVSSLVSLSAQGNGEAKPTDLPRYLLIDGSPGNSQAARTLGALGELLGPPFKSVANRDIPSVLAELSAEVTRRQEAAEPDLPPLFLLVYAIQTVRDLRKDDDDFGYSRYGEDKPPSAAKLFGAILREGPAVGVHVIAWCDTLNNLNRTFDRQALREFEQRVLLQMSGTDSSTLIDTPAASKLGANRALLADEGQNLTEKFRPYRTPPREWLEQALKGSGVRGQGQQQLLTPDS
jgi:energy-coupling factor transporter ATP-binding protein EcfA2